MFVNVVFTFNASIIFVAVVLFISTTARDFDNKKKMFLKNKHVNKLTYPRD